MAESTITFLVLGASVVLFVSARCRWPDEGSGGLSTCSPLLTPEEG